MFEATPVLDSQPASYGEHLAIAWLLAWRGTVFGWLIGTGIGVFLRLFGALLGADQGPVQIFVSVVSLFLGFFVVAPLIVIPSMMKKKFRRFRLAIVRE